MSTPTSQQTSPTFPVSGSTSTTSRRPGRTHALVEGALLTDVAIVFLLMRAYLPVLLIRPTLLAMATVPIVVLVYRRGIRLTLMACAAAFILFSALVGPLLAIAVMHITIAGILLGIGRRAGMNMGLNFLWAGPIYGLLDSVLPTVISVIVFRYPVHYLVDSAKNFIRLMLRFITFVLKGFHASPGTLATVHNWQQPLTSHWQISWLVIAILFGGYGTLILMAWVVEIVLKRIPGAVLLRQNSR